MRAWTTKEIERLRAVYGKVPTEAVAAELGRTRDAVVERARRLGLRQNAKYTPDKVARIRELVGANASPSRIAKIIGGSASGVRDVRTKIRQEAA